MASWRVCAIVSEDEPRLDERLLQRLLHLGRVVLERVSGMSLPDYVAKNIFKPLGMKH